MGTQEAYHHNAEFRGCLDILEVKENELEFIFNTIDKDESGSCDKEEFIDGLYKMKTQNVQSSLVHVGSHIEDLKRKVLAGQREMTNDLRKIAKSQRQLQTVIHKDPSIFTSESATTKAVTIRSET